MFTSTKTSHLLILQELRGLKDEIAAMNQEMADLQTAQFMDEIERLKVQLNQLRATWVPPVVRAPIERPPSEIREPQTFDRFNRQ